MSALSMNTAPHFAEALRDMANSVPMPKLTHTSCYTTPTSDGDYYAQHTTDLDAFLNKSPAIKFENEVNRMQQYDVEFVQPKEEGALSLGLPVLRGGQDPFEELRWEDDIPADALMAARASDPDIKPHLCSGVSIHMGYRPISEEEAFVFAVSSVKVLHASHFTIPRGQMSIEKIIDRIRKVVFSTEEIHEIVPINIHFDSVENTSSMYGSNLLYTTFDEYGNHRFAKFDIHLIAIESPEEIAVLVTHVIGDTRLSMGFFRTVRDYVLSNGTTERKVCPDLQNGFADQYIDEMTEPAYIPGEHVPDYTSDGDDDDDYYSFYPSSQDSFDSSP